MSLAPEVRLRRPSRRVQSGRRAMPTVPGSSPEGPPSSLPRRRSFGAAESPRRPVAQDAPPGWARFAHSLIRAARRLQRQTK